MKKILHIVSALGAGGVENLLFNYSIKGPIFDNFIIDFLTHENSGLIHKLLVNRGFNVYSVPPRKKLLIRNIIETIKVIRKGNYTIVHVHQNHMSFINLIIAKLCGVPIRIVHCHSNLSPIESNFKKIINFFLRFLCIFFATECWACGKAAGEYLYGKKRNFYIMPNAIDGKKFFKKKSNHYQFLEKIHINKNDIIISQIGRFTFEKNHDFTVSLLSELLKRDSRFIFIFAGDGPLRVDIEKKIIDLGFYFKCRFLGNITNVDELLEISAVTLLPSLFEGFPVTIVESLFNGTPILCSSNISDEVELQNLCKRLPCKIDLWIDQIFKFVKITEEEKKNCSIYMLSSKFEINNARKQICDKYITMVNSLGK